MKINDVVQFNEKHEIWKSIKGYENLYEVSNIGNVRNKKNKVLKVKNINSNGYYRVELWKKNKKRNVLIHRLVAETFIPNLNNLPCINHIDMNRKNNCVSNLEWCTQKMNMKFASLFSDNFKQRNKIIIQYDLNGNYLNEYKNINQASEINKINKGNICSCCKNIRKQAGGYIWRYKNES